MKLLATLCTLSIAGLVGAQGSALSFAANAGQWEEPVRFVASPRGAVVAFTDEGVRTRLGGREVVTSFVAPAPGVRAEGEGLAVHRANFYLGDDPRRWRADVPCFASVRYAGVWPGIDVRYSGVARSLEYECRVAPHADVAAIAFRYPGATALAVGTAGELHVTTPAGELVEAAPKAWQDSADGRVAVAVRFRILAQDTFGFATSGGFDPDQELVIDPVLGYSTYLGGASYDEVHDVAVDATGAAYVVGGTRSPDFPATGGPVPGSDYVVFVTKLAPDGASLLYSTFLGGSSHQIGYGLSLRGSSVVVVGITLSTDFPTTVGAFQRSFQSSLPYSNDAFATVLTATGGLAYSTYVGGPGADSAFGVTWDATGAFTLVGNSSATGYPVTPGAFQTTFGGLQDVVVTRIAPNGAGAADLLYSTFLGGSEYEEVHAVSLTGNLEFFVAGATRSADFPASSGAPAGGFDAFVARVRPFGTGAFDLAWARRFGGTNQDYGIGVTDLGGDAVVVGVTYSTDFPTTSGVFQPSAHGGGQDGFVLRLAGDGSALTWSSYLGGSKPDRCVDVAALASGSVVVLGYSQSADFPVTAGALDTTHNGSEDFTISVVSGSGTAVTWSTFFGGTGQDAAYGIAVGSDGAWTFCGNVTSTDYPVTAGAFDTTFNGPPIDAVVSRILQKAPSTWGTGTLTSLGQTPILNWAGATDGPALGDTSGRLVAARLVPGSLAVLVLGSPLQTPLSLTPFGGVPGSVLLLNALTTVSLTADQSGGATLPLPIPIVPALVDGEVSFQVFDLDPALPFPLPLAHSLALTTSIWP